MPAAASPRGPSERQRAAWALAGVFVPAEGQNGRWEDPSWRSAGSRGLAVARIVVTRVSPTGKTAWVRFLGKLRADPELASVKPELEYPYQRWDDGCYRSNGNRSPYGELKF